MAANANAGSEASHSLWMDVAAFSAKPLRASVKTDVAIIGTGICGTSLAYELTRQGLTVVMLDRGQIARGMSCRTSAHLTFQSDDLYQEVISRRGERTAKLHYQSQRAAVDRIEAIVETEKIACDFKRLDGILGLSQGTRCFASQGRDRGLPIDWAIARSAGRRKKSCGD